MSQKQLDFYIDESGDFNDTKMEREHPEELSMVGGLLCDPLWLTKARMDTMLPNRVHAKNGYHKSFLLLLEQLKQSHCRMIVFENTERLRVVNSQVTYANIISEGLVKLFRDLAVEYPEGVHLNIIIAQRQLQLGQYRDRLIEKVQMAYGRNHVEGCEYTLTISDARYDKRLFFADIICNTYLTRNRAEKFTPEEQERIQKLFDQQWIYPVFEDATVMYIKQLYMDGHCGEMMYQICTLPRLQSISNLRDRLIRRISKASKFERKNWFNQLSLQLKLYNEARMFDEGVALAKNYQRYFLDHFEDMPELAQETRFWQFDTDFYLLTMADHQGDTLACEKYLKACNRNLDSIYRSWEHMDYYFRFRLRELMVLMGRFEFENVLRKADQLTKTFKEISSAFQKIGEQNGSETDFQSEVLGKVLGIRLEALTNLVSRDVNYFEKALAVSDQALREFSKPEDLQRQWQYRAQLMASVGKSEDALKCLLRSLNISDIEHDPYTALLSIAYANERHVDDYTLMHYTGVLLLLAKDQSPKKELMGKALLRHPRFMSELHDEKKTGHPWNRVLWHVAQYARFIGDTVLSDYCYERALAITRERPERLTMMTFSVSITAERLLHACDASVNRRIAFERDWNKANHDLVKSKAPIEMLQWFETDSPKLDWQSKAWLK